MTEQEFLALAPRERDAAVAEARGKPKPEKVPVGVNRIHASLDTTWRLGVKSYIPEVWEWVAPPFTTHIATAWQLVEEMDKDGWSSCVDTWPGLGVSACFEHGDSNDPDCEFSGCERSPEKHDYTAPLAISIAYMKARGRIT